MTARLSAAPILHCYADGVALYRALAEAWVTRAQAAIAARGRFHVALSGGNTPRPLYELLAAAPYRDALDWPHIEIWFGDERCVPPDAPRSNFRMVRETLLQYVPVPAANVHRMRGESPPTEAARDYEREVEASFGPGVPARLDLILLGIGEDGHTASLFPGTDALLERRRQVCAQYVAAQQEWRLTLTFPVLNAAAALWVLAQGADKAAILQRVFDGPSQPEVLPIQSLAPDSSQLEWWLDAAASADLQRHTS